MEKLRKDIEAKDFRPIYLLYGEEEYLLSQYKDNLKKALGGEEGNMNFHVFRDSACDIPAIIDLAETLPFFAEKQVLFLIDSGFCKNSADQFCDYIKDGIPETTCIVLVEHNVDKRNKVYKAIDELDGVVEFKTPDEKTLKQWIRKLLKKEGFETSEAAVLSLIDRTGADMDSIKREIDKLISYCQGKTDVTVRDVELLCTKRIQSQIFDMITAIAVKQQKKALNYYYDLLSIKEPVLRILTLVTRQYNVMLQAKELKLKGMDKRQVASALGLNEYIAGKYIDQASRFRIEELKQNLEKCVQAEADIKMGILKDTLAIEMLIIELSA